MYKDTSSMGTAESTGVSTRFKYRPVRRCRHKVSVDLSDATVSRERETTRTRRRVRVKRQGGLGQAALVCMKLHRVALHIAQAAIRMHWSSRSPRRRHHSCHPPSSFGLPLGGLTATRPRLTVGADGPASPRLCSPAEGRSRPPSRRSSDRPGHPGRRTGAKPRYGRSPD